MMHGTLFLLPIWGGNPSYFNELKQSYVGHYMCFCYRATSWDSALFLLGCIYVAGLG